MRKYWGGRDGDLACTQQYELFSHWGWTLAIPFVTPQSLNSPPNLFSSLGERPTTADKKSWNIRETRVEGQPLSTLHVYQNLISFPVISLKWDSVQIMAIWDCFSTHFTLYQEDENSDHSEEVILEENTTLCWVVIFKIYLTCCCKYLKNSASCRILIRSQQQKLITKRKHRSSLATWVSIFTLSLHISVSSFLLLVWTVCWCQSLLWHLPASLPLQNSVLFHMSYLWNILIDVHNSFTKKLENWSLTEGGVGDVMQSRSL